MYLNYNENYWVIDIEGDGLPSSKIWCLCAVNVKTREEWNSTDTLEIANWINERKQQDSAKFIGHNIIGYDAPTLNRLLGTKLSIADLVDTMLLSMLYLPNLPGGHSLEEWGKRLFHAKVGLDIEDWSVFSDEMYVRCKNDVQLTRKIYLRLTAKMSQLGFTEKGCELEHRSWALLKKQKDNGFYFNIKEAHKLYSLLRDYENDLKEEIYRYWPPELQIVARYKRSRKKNGDPTQNFLRHSEEYEKVDELNDGDYVCWDYVSFNIGSPEQRRNKLLELGWKPKEFTKPTPAFPQGQAKTTEKGTLVPSLLAFVEKAGKEEVKLIAQWIDINSRANMINTWMEAFNDKTHCIHGSVWLANTLRLRHSEPNTANIPAVRKNKEGGALRGLEGAFTYEARDLWTTRDPTNRVLVGVDAKGIQLRVLAHYLNNPDFTEAVLNGDPHSYNQEIGGFRDRPTAKTFIFAFLLGAGDGKVGQIIGGTQRDGKAIKERFIGNFPGLSDLLDDLERQIARTGRIILCDGTPLRVTAPHTRLGYLLQGDENRIMKQAAILTDREVRRRKLDVLKVGDIHDEWQNDVLNRDSEEFGEAVLPTAFRNAGEYFDYRIPIHCDVKYGLTWAETH